MTWKNYPLKECLKTVEPLVAGGGCTVFQKFTCYRCKARQTMEVPNHFYTLGTCQECGYVTDIEKWGCNYVAIYSAFKH